MLTTTVNFPTRRAPSPQIRARDAPNDSASNGSAGVNRAPDVNAGANGSPDLGGHRCRDHEDRGDSTNYRKLAEHNLSLPLASYARRYTRRTCRQWPEISTDGNIPHRRDYNILHRNRVDNIPHSNMDIHSTHAYRLDDRPAERADGRVHNSTVHNLVELVWSPSSHSTVLRSWMGTLSQRRQR